MDTPRSGRPKADNIQSTSNGTALISKEESNGVDVVPVIKTLHGLMRAVTEKEINPSTVNAACNCAAQMTALLRVHLEAERLSLKGR